MKYESLDEFYSANLGEEVTRGMRESTSRGFYISAQAPFGYCKVKVNDGSKERTKLEIEPNQAITVAHIFNQVLEGKGLMEVAKHLNREGIAGPRGKGWVKTTIRKILTNEVYTGTLVWGRDSQRDLPPIRVDNAWTASSMKLPMWTADWRGYMMLSKPGRYNLLTWHHVFSS